ncbi:unnamed protein product [Paramecium primaurelia]|uniref:Transmembrane protein n=1 Tax=Paramecium primaurelia TaxID=5886 RepID=A0A8S1L8M4_PARPR|nr:unnamed protein product [Paramecium primaurelia]
MIIILLVIKVICIFPNTQLKEGQEISLYPTVGEFYEYYLGTFLSKSQLICRLHPQVPNVQLINQCEEIYRTKGNQFISTSSNNTHFGTLSNNNEIIIYEWKNQMIQQVGVSVLIDPLYNCYNIDLFQNQTILVDCYYNNEVLLIQIIDSQSIIAYQIKSNLPTSTKIQSILNGTNTFIVYAQYFKKYSILTLFSSSFQNLSSLNNQFIDFDIPITISPNIYAITSQELFQLQISPDSQFNFVYNFSYNNMRNFKTINVYYDFQSASQCDQIQLLCQKGLTTLSNFTVVELFGCERQIIFQDYNCPIKNCESIQKILQNAQFIIYQSINRTAIFQKQKTQLYYFYQNTQSNQLLYFSNDNQLFQFDKEIFVYQISQPSIQINLTKFETPENSSQFTLKCFNYNQIYNFSLINIYLQILSKQDTNIYVMSNDGFNNLLFFQYHSFQKLNFSDYSGQLLNYTLNKNESYFNLYPITLSNYGKINQTYQLIQILVLKINQAQQYFIGYNNQKLDIFIFAFNFKNYSYQFKLYQSINISVNAISLQVAYSIYPSMLIIGLSTNDTIYLIQYNYDKNSIISSNYTFEQQFSDFVVTYNSIIILIEQQDIQILTFNYTVTYTLNQQSINKLFNNITFNPIQIVVNTQSLSSFVYINNINEVIIISIDQNSYPIPISLIQVNFTIKQINLVNQQLILSYICNNQNNICFQVWNVQNLPKYYYVKNLYSVNFDNNIIIQSDNLFFYVTFSNYTVYVYNPLLPYHMSLYYKLELTSPIQCTEQFYLNNPLSVIIANNYLYTLQELQQFNLTVQQSNYVFNNSISYPQLTFNYTVTSALNNNTFQQTPNQSIIFYLNFTQFQDLRNLSIELSKDNIIPYSKNFSYPMNLILDRQVGYCYLNNILGSNQYCSLTQFLQQSSNISNIQNYSLITSINNEYFALQSNSSIQTLSSDLRYLFYFNYTNLTFSQCLQSTSYIYQLYSICQNSTSQYLLNFTLDSQGFILNLNTIQLPQTFQKISKMSSILNQIFILGTFTQIIQSQQLYWFNQSNNNFYQISNSSGLCQDFSIAQIVTTISAIQQYQQLIVFYIQIGELIQNLSFKYISIQNNQVKIQKRNFVASYLCYQQNNCKLILPSFVLIMQTYNNRVIILLSNFANQDISEIIEFRLQQNIFYFVIIGTIPNYGNLTNTGNNFYKNGVLMQQFQSNTVNIVGVYYLNNNNYLNNLLNGDILKPILMLGSFTATNNSYAMIVNQEYKNGTTLYISNQIIFNYSLSTWNVTCVLNSHTKYKANVTIFCDNEFSNGIYNIFFYPPQLDKVSKRWIYALLTIIALLLFYFYIKVKSKTKNLGYINAEIEL